MPDYSEVRELQDQRAEAAAPSSHALMALLRESQRGAVVLEELLRDPAWDIFRSNIAGELKPAEMERARLRDEIETGALVGDERAKADLRLQYLRGRLEALQLALDLPRALIGKHTSLEKIVGGNGKADADGATEPWVADAGSVQDDAAREVGSAMGRVSRRADSIHEKRRPAPARPLRSDRRVTAKRKRRR